MNEHFTEPAREALLRAGHEARELRHTYVGTEHILLALLGAQGGTAGRALASAGVTHERVRRAVVRMMGRGVDVGAGELPWTGRAQDAIGLAREEARVRGADEAGTEHILLALVHERDGAAMRILDQLDADPVAISSALGAG